MRRLANYGLQDGKIFDFISRTTPTSGQEMSYLTPLFTSDDMAQGYQAMAAKQTPEFEGK